MAVITWKVAAQSAQSTPDDTKVINQIRDAHDPDVNFHVGDDLLSMAQDILGQATSTLPEKYLEEEQDDSPHQGISEELAFIIHGIGCKLSCNCSGWGDMKPIIQTVFNTLVKYSWEDKVALALSAFAVNYGEFCILLQLHTTDYRLAKYVVHLKPLPEMLERETLIRNLLQVVIHVVQTIIKLNGLNSPCISRQQPPLFEAINEFPTAAYWAIKGIVACSAESIGLMEMGPKYMVTMTEARKKLITDLTQRLEKIHVYLTKILDQCNEEIENYKINQTYHELQHLIESIHASNMEVLIELIHTKDELLPLYNGETEINASLDDLKNSPVILFISYWNISDEEINEIVKKIGRSEGQYKVVWLPIEDESAISNEEKYKEIDRKASLMNWYSLRSSLKLRSHVIKYIKEDWHFEEEPLLVVFDAQGKVVRSNAYHMAMIWGSAAYPFDIGTEITLWQESIWNLEFLIEGVFIHSEEEQISEGKKLICFCGGDDLVRIANFISKAKEVIEGDGIILEFIYVGTKRVENIEGIQIKYWDDLQKMQFRARLNSIMHSIMQPHMTINKVDILNDVMMLLGAQGSGQEWTVLGQYGSENVTAVNGNIMMESLDYIQTIGEIVITVENFFPTLVNVIQVVAPNVPKHCNHIIFSSTSGINGKDLYCVCCRGRMQKYTMYKCCVE